MPESQGSMRLVAPRPSRRELQKPPHGRLREALLQLTEESCESCERHFPSADLEVDHQVPIWKDPEQDRHALANVQLLCIGCHRQKTRVENRRRAALQRQ